MYNLPRPLFTFRSVFPGVLPAGKHAAQHAVAQDVMVKQGRQRMQQRLNDDLDVLPKGVLLLFRFFRHLKTCLIVSRLLRSKKLTGRCLSRLGRVMLFHAARNAFIFLRLL